MSHVSHHQTRGKTGPAPGLMYKISVQTSSPEDRLWMLTREVLWEMLFCPICRTSLNSKALEGTGSG